MMTSHMDGVLGVCVCTCNISCDISLSISYSLYIVSLNGILVLIKIERKEPEM